jgi:exodeoxyribonuclease VIII
MRELKRALAFSHQMTSAEYHAHAAISNSRLTLLAKNPAYFKFILENPSEPTRAMRDGSLIHEALLLPDDFFRNHVVMPEVDRRTKAGKELYEKFLIENEGKAILSPEEFETINSIKRSVYTHPTAKKLLESGHAELSFFWEDEASGIECKCRPDFLRAGHIVVDVKTTEDASFTAFQKSILNYRYHVQAAFYLDGLSVVTGDKYDTFVFVVVEKRPPYQVAVYCIDEASVEKGREVYRNNLTTLAECRRRGLWPGYPEQIQTINLPAWGF